MGTPNTLPSFVKQGNIGAIAVTAANTKSDGTGTIGTDIFLLLTSGANGSFVEKVRFNATASVAGTVTTATVGRVFRSTKTAGGTLPADTDMLEEITLPSVTADATAAAVAPLEVFLEIRLKPGESLLVSNHAAPAANSAWKAIAFGGDY